MKLYLFFFSRDCLCELVDCELKTSALVAGIAIDITSWHSRKYFLYYLSIPWCKFLSKR